MRLFLTTAASTVLVVLVAAFPVANKDVAQEHHLMKRVPVCESTGNSVCDPATHTLHCYQICKDCDGIVCTGAWISTFPCGSC
ncbi:MAG: hypothetical protein J3R72DRAFT_443297 [Linnemannia gamsii]|nr:MAG: hypothetical protein J3R72DRAFT_443297 [Linnemannia gamsii]